MHTLSVHLTVVFRHHTYVIRGFSQPAPNKSNNLYLALTFQNSLISTVLLNIFGRNVLIIDTVS